MADIPLQLSRQQINLIAGSLSADAAELLEASKRARTDGYRASCVQRAAESLALARQLLSTIIK